MFVDRDAGDLLLAISLGAEEACTWRMVQKKDCANWQIMEGRGDMRTLSCRIVANVLVVAPCAGT